MNGKKDTVLATRVHVQVQPVPESISEFAYMYQLDF